MFREVDDADRWILKFSIPRAVTSLLAVTLYNTILQNQRKYVTNATAVSALPGSYGTYNNMRNKITWDFPWPGLSAN